MALGWALVEVREAGVALDVIPTEAQTMVYVLRLAADSAVAAASDDKWMRPLFTVNDPGISQMWHFDIINASEAWDITRGARDVVVAVIDDGFDIDHPDFQGVGKIVQPRDFVDGDAKPFPTAANYHGTPCAGVAIAEANGRGVVGVAPGCAFMPVRITILRSTPHSPTQLSAPAASPIISAFNAAPIAWNEEHLRASLKA